MSIRVERETHELFLVFIATEDNVSSIHDDDYCNKHKIMFGLRFYFKEFIFLVEPISN